MRVTILTDRTTYNYHVPYAEVMQQYLESIGFTVTVQEAYEDGMQFRVIKETMPDYVITLDLAGFLYHTYTDGCSLATIPDTKSLCMIWGDDRTYDRSLNQTVSAAMRFYDLTGTDYHFMDRYDTLYYYKPWTPFPKPGKYADPRTVQTEVARLFPALWSDFLSNVCYEEERY